VHTECFWNNLHQICSRSRDCKTNQFKSLWEQETKEPKHDSRDRGVTVTTHRLAIRDWKYQSKHKICH